MKIVKKILYMTMAFILLFAWSPIKHSAIAADTYNYCAPDRGKDIVFVINDTLAMSNVDLTTDPDSNENYITEAINFSKSLNENDRVGVIGFNEEANNYLSLTSNKYRVDSELRKFLDSDRNRPGGNDLSSGLELAINELKKNGNSNEKSIIVMTTGSSIDSTKSFKLADEAYENQISIHVLGFGTINTADEFRLTTITEKTEGEYYFISRLTDLQRNFLNLFNSVGGFTGDVIRSDYTLQNDETFPNGLLIQENTRLNLNGYNLTVEGDLILQNCAELRAVSGGEVYAQNVDQRANSIISLNNSKLVVENTFKQNGIVRINGQFGKDPSTTEIETNQLNQNSHGVLQLNGQSLKVVKDFHQKGTVEQGRGTITVGNDVIQQGKFNVQGGNLFISGNLTIDGGPLVDDQFTQNKSLNIGGGFVQVGALDSMNETRSKGNVYHLDGQLYVNYGAIDIYGDYSISNGWLTMIHGTMDTETSEYGKGDGDYVHVFGDFSISSLRNHAKRDYTLLGTPMNDVGHLTNGILQVDGNFNQFGYQEAHTKYSDKSQNYEKDFSKYNFTASGKHKVLLTGKGSIQIESTGFKFNILDVEGKLSEYSKVGPVSWNKLIERSVSSNANLETLKINDQEVPGFNPNKYIYFMTVKDESATPGARSLKVDSIAQDSRNADVQVLSNVVNSDGTAEVVVLVTANDGETTATYTVYVTVGEGTDGRVTSIEIDQKELVFLQQQNGTYSPSKESLKYTVYPKNADNQQVIWTSTDESVVTVRDGIVEPVGIGQATVIAKTVDGNFTDATIVKVLLPYDLLEGIDNFADLVSDSKRYDEITAVYDLNNIGIVVPGQYINSVTFNTTTSGYAQSGTVKTDPTVKKIDVLVNNRQLPVPTPLTPDEYTFTRTLKTGDYIEVIAYNDAGDELERIYTNFPVGFSPNKTIPSGYYSLQDLLNNTYIFELILDNYVLEDLRFEAK